MSEQAKAFAARCDQIQAKCACQAIDAAECLRTRYAIDSDDDQDDQRCECYCHQEIGEDEDTQDWV